jgi:hypothetical protein
MKDLKSYSYEKILLIHIKAIKILIWILNLVSREVIIYSSFHSCIHFTYMLRNAIHILCVNFTHKFHRVSKGEKVISGRRGGSLWNIQHFTILPSSLTLLHDERFFFFLSLLLLLSKSHKQEWIFNRVQTTFSIIS